MPAVHPDAHFDPRFLKALQTSVRRALPPTAWRQWCKPALTIVAVLLFLAGMMVIVTLLGFAAGNSLPIAAALGLFFAAMLAAPPGEQSNLAVFVRALAQYPAEPRHALHWVRRMETVTLCVFPGLALTCAILYLIGSRSSAERWQPVLSAAAGAGFLTSGVYALLHFFPAMKPLRWLALLICLGTLFAPKEKNEADSVLGQIFTALNPVIWPLPALHRPLETPEMLRLSAGIAGSIAVLFFAWRNLPRFAAANVEKFGISENVTATQAGRPLFTLRLPAICAAGSLHRAGGFWERLIEHSRTPQERALAAFNPSPDATTLNWRFVQAALCCASLVGCLQIFTTYSTHSPGLDGDTAAFVIGVGLFGPVFIAGHFLFGKPGRDGYPFQALFAWRQMPNGQSALPYGFFPISGGTLTMLWLKSSWPRVLLFTATLAATWASAAAIVNPHLHWHLMAGVLMVSPYILALHLALGGGLGSLPSGALFSSRWMLRLLIQAIFFTAVVHVLMTFAWFLVSIYMGLDHLAVAVLVCTLPWGFIHFLHLRMLSSGTADLWRNQPPSRRP